MSDLFLKRENGRRIDCAEAVVRRYGAALGGTTGRDRESREWGRGKAPEGLCGAFYAARVLLQDAGRHGCSEALSRHFAEVAGAHDCRTVRRRRQAGCRACVDLVSGFLDRVAEGEACAGVEGRTPRDLPGPEAFPTG